MNFRNRMITLFCITALVTPALPAAAQIWGP